MNQSFSINIIIVINTVSRNSLVLTDIYHQLYIYNLDNKNPKYVLSIGAQLICLNMLHIYGKLRFRDIKWLPKTDSKSYSWSNDKALTRRISLITWYLGMWLGPWSNTNTLTKIQDNSEYYGFLKALTAIRPFTALGRLRYQGRQLLSRWSPN